jgi:hypothetical protein
MNTSRYMHVFSLYMGKITSDLGLLGRGDQQTMITVWGQTPVSHTRRENIRKTLRTRCAKICTGF